VILMVMQRRERMITVKNCKEMMKCGYKVELEALYWLGMDFVCDWLDDLLWDNEHDSSLII